MTLGQELAALFARDLAKLRQEIEAFGDHLWTVLPGVTNSGGNLALHLEGNLREYIGRQLGGIAYERKRPLEFSTKDLPAADLAARIASLEVAIPAIVSQLTDDSLSAIYPENVLGEPLSTRRFLVHIHGHLTYHLGQLNYLRRISQA
jgi:hypothetical protein